MATEALELVEVTAEAMGWDDGRAWCPCGAEMVHHDDAGTLVCDTCGTDAIDGEVRS
jgi:hypothetical protein